MVQGSTMLFSFKCSVLQLTQGPDIPLLGLEIKYIFNAHYWLSDSVRVRVVERKPEGEGSAVCYRGGL